jgi:stalled ribosome rescue protein Dom34
MRNQAVWIDQNEARVFHIEGATFEEKTVHAATHHVHRHSKEQLTKAHNHHADQAHFFDEVLARLTGAEEILLLGPSVTKLHLLWYAQEHRPRLAAQVVGVESADHPTDRQLVAHVRHYFHDDPPRLRMAS